MKAPRLFFALSLCACMQLAGLHAPASAADDQPPETAAPAPAATTDDKPAATDAALMSVPSPQSDADAQSATKAAPNPVDEIGPVLAKKLQDLESHFFGHIYLTEAIERRVVRLERFVFGTESGGPFLTRIDHVASSLNVSDPDGTKREIPLKPKEPPKPAAVAEETPQPAPASAPAPKLDELTKAAAEAPAQAPAIPRLVDSPEDHGSVPQMEVAPVVGTPNRKIAEISTAVAVEKRGALLQVTMDYFATPGKPNEIIKELSQAIRVHANDPELMFERAKAYIQLEKYDAAVNDLADAIMNQPNKSAYYVARAWCYRKMGNVYLAADDVKQAHFVDPGLPLQVEFLLNSKMTPVPAEATE